jgi:hypothetical protein
LDLFRTSAQRVAEAVITLFQRSPDLDHQPARPCTGDEDYSAALLGLCDSAIKRSIIEDEKSLIHGPAARAKKPLFVGSSGQLSERIKHLENANALET